LKILAQREEIYSASLLSVSMVHRTLLLFLLDSTTVLAFEFVYDLDGKKAILISMSDDISVPAIKQARVNR
jgi:hypothetical protein